jgi:glycosyltransferase involved in cell wall biosynthesis
MSKKLKIGMMLSSDTTISSGIPEHVLYLSEELRRRGHTVHIFGSHVTSYPFKNYHGIGYVTNVPFLNGGYGPIMTSMPDKNALNMIKKYNFDIFHIHDPYVPFLNYEIAPALSLDMPVIGTFHTAWQDGSLVSHISQALRIFKDYFAEHMAGVIFVSEGARKCWQPLVKRSLSQKIIYNGVGHEYNPAEKKTHKTVNLIYVGRLVKRKGIHYLLEAMAYLVETNPEVRLTVIGDGPEMEKAVLFVKENKLGKYVTFKGEIRGKEKMELLQQADIFCASYTHEAFALTILEAMACGIPIIGFWDKGIDHALTGYPQKNKVLIQKRDGEALANVLKKGIEDPVLRKPLSDWCEKQSHMFTWEKVVDETEDFYYSFIK